MTPRRFLYCIVRFWCGALGAGEKICRSLDSRGIGGEGDIAEAYRYRDWVVAAFNSDLPYYQFILQQVAGDILAPQGTQFVHGNVVHQLLA